MVQPKTVMPSLTDVDFANRLAPPPLYPRPWTGDEAKAAGGLLYSLMQAFGSQFVGIEQQLQYAQAAMRIATATDQALDRVANDFFGSVIGFPEIMKRNTGEPDSSFRQRIFASLLLDAVTRSAIINVLQLYTNSTPRVVEPWDPTLTGSYDTNVSYYDFDPPQSPARYGDTLPAQFFVESQLPPYHGANYPIYGYDSGLTYDFLSAPGGYYLDPQSTWFSGATSLDALLNRTKALGTTIWRRYNSQALVSYSRAQTTGVAAGATQLVVNLLPASAGFMSILAMANWDTAISWQQNSQTQFTLRFSTAVPPGGGAVDWIATPTTSPGYVYVPILANTIAQSIVPPSTLAGYKMIALASWNTNIWFDTQSDSLVNLKFNVPALAGSLLTYGMFPPARSGNQAVSAGSTSVSISLTLTKPGSEYQAFVLPGWNTGYAVTKSAGGMTIEFDNPPPVDSSLNWGFFQS